MANDDRQATKLEELIEKAFKTMLADVELGLPARVVSYDPEGPSVTVEPIARKRYKDGTSEKLEPIANVPVQFPGGAGFVFVFPLEPGDPVWLAFSGRPFDAWLTTGRDAAEEPTRRRFSSFDCVAYPHGPRPFGTPIASADTDSMVLGEDDGLQMRIRQGKVSIGDGTTELLSLFDDLLDDLQTAATVSGGPFDAATLAKFEAIQTSLATIKE